METEIERAAKLFAQYQPPDTIFTIETNLAPFGDRYLFRLLYQSPKSGRSMCITCKGDVLPDKDDAILAFYVRQLVLSPAEVTREFARIYYREKQARQQLFLSGQLGNIRVTDIMGSMDKTKGYGELVG